MESLQFWFYMNLAFYSLQKRVTTTIQAVIFIIKIKERNFMIKIRILISSYIYIYERIAAKCYRLFLNPGDSSVWEIWQNLSQADTKGQW